ncbi:MAG: metal-dependent hydrolase [Leptospirillia bacterium]
MNRLLRVCVKGIGLLVVGMVLPLIVSPAFAEGETTVSWHGHSAFSIETPSGHMLWIDPWLNNPKNPNAGEGKDAVAGVEKGDYILLTHGHFDHVGDAVALAKKTGARLVTSFELGQNLAKLQGFPADQMGFDTLMNPGGELTLLDGEVKVLMTPAIHSSSVKNPKAGPNEPDMVYGGSPGGFLVTVTDGPSIYHSGDTDFFKEMHTLGHCRCITLALMNAGGHFGMEPKMAAYAAQTVGARYAVVHHWGTFPILSQDTSEFEEGVGKRRGWFRRSKTSFLPLEPGGSLVFSGDELKE